MPELVVCGVVNWDTLLFVEDLPGPGEEVRVARMAGAPGGKGANTAVAAARILGRNAAALVATLGNDGLAERELEIMEQEGVDTSAVVRMGQNSGQAFVAIDSRGEDMIMTHMAANGNLSPELLDASECVSSLISHSKSIVIIDPPLAAAEWLASKSRAVGRTLIMTPALLTS